MDLRPDGTIVITMPKKADPAAGETVTLRRPVLEELFERWESLDKLNEEQVKTQEQDAAADGTERDVNGRPIRRSIETMRLNTVWLRDAIAALGTPQVYTRGEDGVLTIRDDLEEPGWFASPTAAGRMLVHWQEVPLAPGSVR